MTTSIEGPRGARPVVVEVRLPGEPSTGRVAERSAGEPAARAASERATVETERVVEASQQVEQFFQSVRRNLQFREDAVSGRVVVSVIDAETGEVIRQIPPEQVVRMARSLEQTNGLLLGERA
jgi:flagellar protein FlaG